MTGRARALGRLVVLSVGVNLVEAGILLGCFPATGLALAAQANAVAPFGTFHDLRWLAVSDASWPAFLLAVAALLLGRGALVAVSVHWAWPAGLEGPSLLRLWARGVASTAMAAVLLAPSTVLLFGLAVVSVSWLFIAAVPLALLVALIVNPVAVRGGWWRRGIPLVGAGWVLASFVVLSVCAVVIAESPWWAALPVVATAGAFNALAWRGLSHAVVRSSIKQPSRLMPVVPVALVVLLGGVAAGSVLGFQHAKPAVRLQRATAAADPQRGDQAVIVVDGYGSTWDGSVSHPIPGPFFEERFSYVGLSNAGAPLPYWSTDTVQPLSASVKLLAAQVTHLAHATGRPVDLVAESEGALVADTYVLVTPVAPVHHLVLLSPLVAPGQVTYPLDGTGDGLAISDALEAIGTAYRSVSPVNLVPTNSFLRSLDELAPHLQDELLCPVKSVQRFAVLPMADATALPPTVHLPFPSVVVPAFHGGLITQTSVDDVVSKVLRGENPRGSLTWRAAEDAIADASTAWQVPNIQLARYEPVRNNGQTIDAACRALVRLTTDQSERPR